MKGTEKDRSKANINKGVWGNESWDVMTPSARKSMFFPLVYKPEPVFDTLKSAHLVVSFCWAPPHVQTAWSPRILATYTDTITLCLGSRYLGSPRPTSFAAAASKSSNSLGLCRTRHLSYWIPTFRRQMPIVPVHFLNCAPIARNCALIVWNWAPIAGYQVVQNVKKCPNTDKMCKIK